MVFKALMHVIYDMTDRELKQEGLGVAIKCGAGFVGRLGVHQAVA